MPDEKEPVNASRRFFPGKKRGKIKVEAFGREMVEKEVRLNGINGLLYPPRDWVGCRVKVIRLD